MLYNNRVYIINPKCSFTCLVTQSLILNLEFIIEPTDFYFDLLTLFVEPHEILVVLVQYRQNLAQRLFLVNGVLVRVVKFFHYKTV